MTLTLFCYVTLTSDDLETTSKQLAGHMLVRNDTLFVIVHHLFQMLCTNPEVYGRWRPFWICVKIGDLPWRDLWGFSTVDRKGTHELISGEKPFIAILSNLKCLFTRLIPFPSIVPCNNSLEMLLCLETCPCHNGFLLFILSSLQACSV